MCDCCAWDTHTTTPYILQQLQHAACLQPGSALRRAELWQRQRPTPEKVPMHERNSRHSGASSYCCGTALDLTQTSERIRYFQTDDKTVKCSADACYTAFTRVAAVRQGPPDQAHGPADRLGPDLCKYSLKQAQLLRFSGFRLFPHWMDGCTSNACG